jgi:hypothetical protein
MEKKERTFLIPFDTIKYCCLTPNEPDISYFMARTYYISMR